MTFDEASASPVRVGVAGLGRAFVLSRTAFVEDPRVRLIAAAEPRELSRKAFVQEFGGKTYETVDELCGDADVELVYVSTPHELHFEHVRKAAAAGKHVLVEKPLAISLDDGIRMTEACSAAGVHLIIGPSHSFDMPVQMARAIIREGEFGRLRLINAFNYTDFLYRPRRPEELDTARGGGVVFSQGVHQIDIVRLLAGGLVRQVSAYTGSWDPERPTEGAYIAQLAFDGCIASITYSGYGFFDSDEWMDGFGELGARKNMQAYGSARRALKARGAASEMELKAARTYGLPDKPSTPESYEHFGPIIVSLEKADLRLTPAGLHVYAEDRREFRPAPPFRFSRSEMTAAIHSAVRLHRPPVQSGRWGLASLEVCHAMLKSAADKAPVRLEHQVGANDHVGS
ncbi:Gfo/Idh/MocA family oxidoreductase [Rhizobium leguminosarum]|uniref:Gfo/Idh/MocA family oxidoreductase n=1 Tax=Rhizobium leguminosarum TaxID=384 RepID=UPI001C915521|nr:Gfo/Idh/MocA family oxidoreductase [Rhizobium leguminosarum]MBY2912570.1 Gfo/Idh/MocA family oxidoreductase [Rhizobium leguminosarum]MBY2968227.1 Gfo/Idh/MocA family oxidoreductase [Rhizobium leguminosarum]MBY2975602.1 Gfo/Idh/MocA family oxidoreductase [Rhizobium leguminosarum]MBY2997091.1 Gfo/Idh/MocA family oxidoreductase [Rhizobium leguminosarum]MBY3004152.1 Gfo/Idh/MocA family oxidoreductase [Rhizobium leguminosarum]